MNITEFLRFLINLFQNDKYTQVLIQEDKKWKDSLLYEVSRYGNNLNQIAHNLNVMNYKGYSRFPHKKIEEQLDKISQLTKDLENIRLKISEVYK